MNVYTLRMEVLKKAAETGQRLGQAFFNYFLTKDQQDYVIEASTYSFSYRALYQINSKVEFTAWCIHNVIDYDPITLRHHERNF